jgi:hypothetical protein
MANKTKSSKIIDVLQSAVLVFGVLLCVAWASLLVWLVLRVFHVA